MKGRHRHAGGVIVIFVVITGLLLLQEPSITQQEGQPQHHGITGSAVTTASRRDGESTSVAPPATAMTQLSSDVEAPAHDDSTTHPRRDAEIREEAPSAPVAAAVSANHTSVQLFGQCSTMATSVMTSDGQFVSVDDPAIRADTPFPCPLLSDKQVRLCGRTLAGGRLTTWDKKANVRAELKSALETKSTQKVVSILDGACEWAFDPKHANDPFEEIAQARALIGPFQQHIDCAPGPEVSVTAHHLHAARKDSVYDLGPRLMPMVPIPNAGHTTETHLTPASTLTTDGGRLEPGFRDSIAYRAAVFDRTTRYERQHRTQRFIRLDNICMSCEPKGEFFMAPRKCYTTLWSVNEFTLGLESKARKGRHTIFKEREGGFQYGGLLRTPPRDVLVVRGTTFFLTQFQNDNVGHVLRDAAWMFHVITATRRSGGRYPRPHHAMMDADMWNTSSSYYAFLTTVAALRNLGRDDEMLGGQLNGPRPTEDGSLGSPPLLLNPVMGGGREKLVCFESAVFGGRDRKGVNSGKLITRDVAAARFRSEMLQFLELDPATVAGNITRSPRIYVFGRQDVHRRRIENVGALTEAIALVAREAGLPPPTVITTLHMKPAKQIELFAGVDILVSVQGAHLEQHLFMPPDGVILEIAQCFSQKTSFISRYGTYHPRQTFKQLRVCTPRINFADTDKRAQDLVLCPHHLKQLQTDVRDTVEQLKRSRAKSR